MRVAAPFRIQDPALVELIPYPATGTFTGRRGSRCANGPGGIGVANAFTRDNRTVWIIAGQAGRVANAIGRRTARVDDLPSASFRVETIGATARTGRRFLGGCRGCARVNGFRAALGHRVIRPLRGTLLGTNTVTAFAALITHQNPRVIAGRPVPGACAGAGRRCAACRARVNRFRPALGDRLIGTLRGTLLGTNTVTAFAALITHQNPRVIAGRPAPGAGAGTGRRCAACRARRRAPRCGDLFGQARVKPLDGQVVRGEWTLYYIDGVRRKAYQQPIEDRGVRLWPARNKLARPAMRDHLHQVEKPSCETL